MIDLNPIITKVGAVSSIFICSRKFAKNPKTAKNCSAECADFTNVYKSDFYSKYHRLENFDPL